MLEPKRKMYKTGGTHAVNLPKVVVSALGAKCGDTIAFKEHRGRIYMEVEK